MVSVSKISRNYVVPNLKKMTNSAKNIAGEIKGTGKYYKNNFKTGWQTGTRLSKIKKHNQLRSCADKFVGGFSKTKVKQEHIPMILGGIGAVSPIPGGSIVGYGVGKLITKMLKAFK